MKILTQNCWGIGKNRDKRFKIISKTIKNRSYDLVCLQEIFLNGWQKEFEDIGYHASYVDCLTLIGLTKLKGGLVTLTKEKPKKVEFHRYKSQGSFFRKDQWGDRLLGKGFLEVILEDTTVLNTHNLCTYTNEEIYGPYLESQIEQLLEHIRKIKTEKRKLVVAGDFNFVRESPFYLPFICELKDATEGLDMKYDLFKYKQVDYIFFNGKNQTFPKYVSHLGQCPSDHPGICVEVFFK